MSLFIRLAALLIAAVLGFSAPTVATAQQPAPATAPIQYLDWAAVPPVCQVKVTFEKSVSDLSLTRGGSNIAACVGMAIQAAGGASNVWLQWTGKADIIFFIGETVRRNNISQAGLGLARVSLLVTVAEKLGVPTHNMNVVVGTDTDLGDRTVVLRAFNGPPVRWRLTQPQATAIAAVPGLQADVAAAFAAANEAKTTAASHGGRLTALEARPTLAIRPWFEAGALAGTVASPSVGGGPVIRLGITLRAGDWALSLSGGAGYFERLGLDGRLLVQHQSGRSSVALGLGTYLFTPTPRGVKTTDGGTAWIETGYAQSRIHGVGEYAFRVTPDERLPVQVILSGALGPGESGLTTDSFHQFVWWNVGLGARVTVP